MACQGIEDIDRREANRSGEFFYRAESALFVGERENLGRSEGKIVDRFEPVRPVGTEPHDI